VPTVLDLSYENVDYRSLDMDHFINSVAATCDYIQAKKKSKKKINLSLDEWNVWKSQGSSRAEKRWQIAPSEFEDVYTLEDALVAGCCLITLLKHADRVKMACIAQLINIYCAYHDRKRRPPLATNHLLSISTYIAVWPRNRTSPADLQP
jgi:alpha-L-arabinofuranosidase